MALPLRFLARQLAGLTTLAAVLAAPAIRAQVPAWTGGVQTTNATPVDGSRARLLVR